MLSACSILFDAKFYSVFLTVELNLTALIDRNILSLAICFSTVLYSSQVNSICQCMPEVWGRISLHGNQDQLNRIKTRKYKIRYSVRLSNTTYYGAKWMLFDFFGKLRNDDDLLGKKPSWIGVTKGGIFYFGLIVTHCQSYHPIVSKCFIKNFSLQMTQFLRWNLSDGSSEVNHHIIPDVFHTILGPEFWHHLHILLSGVKRNALQSERFNIPLLLRRSVQRSWRLQLFIQVRIPSF